MSEAPIPDESSMTIAIDSKTVTAARDQEYWHFEDKLIPNLDLNRQLVSYQADKETPLYRWLKYREGFTSQLVYYLLKQVHPKPGMLLDPFAGSGSALFASSELGWQSCGIEVLPVGVFAMQARIAANKVDLDQFVNTARKLKEMEFAPYYDSQFAFDHIPITQGAFPQATEQQLVGYLAYCNSQIQEPDIRKMAIFAAFCVLEEISYTRKDGQYLRWDHRSGRSLGKKPFDKGRIVTFGEAIRGKLDQMIRDLNAFNLNGIALPGEQLKLKFDEEIQPRRIQTHTPQVIRGSCLDVLPSIPSGSVDCFLTSPPYANRYDYTRTYALELVFLGCGREDVVKLRQTMLSCTVENRAKRDYMQALYDDLHRSNSFEKVEKAFNEQLALQEVLSILDEYRAKNELNNANIASLVRNYFYEMCFVVHEMSRILRPGGHVIMVNDNVRYAGEEIPVDLILSSFAERFGLRVEMIWTLPKGKGNSSQQMGTHGRSELRKCVYVWQKP